MTANLTVGEFSRMTYLSVKTLRHYHQVGLLEPAQVNPGTGYRYYLAEQIPDIWQPETALEFNEVGKNVCGFTPQNPLFSWEAEYWYFCKAAK